LFAETSTNGATINTEFLDTTPTKRRPGRPKGSKNKETRENKKNATITRYINSKDINSFFKLPADIQKSIRNLITFGFDDSKEDDISFDVED
jgi:hypothetical protein